MIKFIKSVKILRKHAKIFLLTKTIFLSLIQQGSSDTITKYGYIFAGFPDIRFQGGGMTHPHSEMNPATLELSQKYDISLSTGISPIYKSSLLKITDSKTSIIGGGIYIKCISKKFLCYDENTNILSGDLSYSFEITDITIGFGASLKWKTNNNLEKELGKKTLVTGIGTIFKKEFDKIILTGGFSSFLIHDKIAGGTGLSLSNDDMLIFAQVFYIGNKLIPNFGGIFRILTWFRLLASYHKDITAGTAFVSPKLYLWFGYSTFKKNILLNIGIAF